MELLLLLLVIAICVFILYILSKQDFVLLRQNISLREIFDIAILTVIVAFVTGRAFYIVTSSKLDLFIPVRFFHMFKFPGFSVLGFFLGGALALFFAFRKNKGLSRIYDIFSISFMPVYMLNFALRDYPKMFFVIPIALFLSMIVLFAFLIRSHYKYLLRDGSVSLILLLILTTDTFIYQYVGLPRISFFPISLSQMISVVLALLSLIMLLSIQKGARK